MMLGHMGETDTDGDQCSSWYSSISISAHECDNFVFKTPFCIHRYEYENVTSLRSYFLKVLNVGAGPDLNWISM